MAEEEQKGVQWRINGGEIAPGAWICTVYSGRGDLTQLDLDNFRLVLWEALIPLETFIALYHGAYMELIEEEREQSPYEWGVVQEYDQLRHAGYPGLRQLIDEHARVFHDLLLNDEEALMEMLYIDEPRHYRIGYAIHSLNEVLVLGDQVMLAGLAVEQEEI